MGTAGLTDWLSACFVYPFLSSALRFPGAEAAASLLTGQLEVSSERGKRGTWTNLPAGCSVFSIRVYVHLGKCK